MSSQNILKISLDIKLFTGVFKFFSWAKQLFCGFALKPHQNLDFHFCCRGDVMSSIIITLCIQYICERRTLIKPICVWTSIFVSRNFILVSVLHAFFLFCIFLFSIFASRVSRNRKSPHQTLSSFFSS